VDSANDNDVVALDEILTLTKSPPEHPVLGRHIDRLAILVGESESVYAMSQQLKRLDPNKCIHRPPDMKCKPSHVDGIMLGRVVTNLNLAPELWVTRPLDKVSGWKTV
jgi:hypothetical protein